MKVVFVAIVMLAARANAFWFFGRNEETTATADGAPVDASCVALGQAGDCEFFNCFEQRLPCGRDFYMQKFGNYYCNRFQSFLDTFTEEGRQFLQNSRRCVTQRLLDYYSRDYVNCHTLEHDAVSFIRPCYTQNGFCDIIGDNRDQFLQVFNIRDLFSSGAGKLWREVVGLAQQCGGQALSSFWSAARSRLNPMNYFFGDDDSEETVQLD